MTIEDCPYCGNYRDNEVVPLDGYFQVRCSRCGTRGMATLSQQGAIDAWNEHAVMWQKMVPGSDCSG